MPQPPISAPYNDYAQSANTLFHFMSERKYLESILTNKAIVPRYCSENIEYLNICVDGIPFKEVLLLQKCFCDIPFHKLTESFELSGVGAGYESLTDNEKTALIKSNTHPEYYGKYAIAFSKSWGENAGLQPVHYLNENSSYTVEFSKMINSVLNTDDITDEYANDILNRLSFMKPLRGSMMREIKRETSGMINVEFQKNFHDEKEWRYVPNSSLLENAKIDCIIANPKMRSMFNGITDINRNLTKEKYKRLWLEYSYDDIRYIVVPDLQSRIDIINTIVGLQDTLFDNRVPALQQKYILISKILVLEEIRKDW